ncbi:MAG: hypothetical protein E5Y35_16880, partial [Mesorhizobium sp.]
VARGGAGWQPDIADLERDEHPEASPNLVNKCLFFTQLRTENRYAVFRELLWHSSSLRARRERSVSHRRLATAVVWPPPNMC